MNTRQWIIATINYYRELDFFKDYSNLSNEKIADTLENIQKEDSLSDGTFNSQREEDILALDKKRTVPISLEDIYGDPFAQENYVKKFNRNLIQEQTLVKGLLLDLSYISRGIFLPQNISCLSYNGDFIPVIFTIDNIEYSLNIEPIDDPSLVVSKINPIIRDTNYQFEIWSLPQKNLILVLTFEEKKKLKKEKKWYFADSNSDYKIQDIENHNSPLVRKIYHIANSVDLGLESSAPVQVYLTPVESYEAACKEIFCPEDEISYMTLKAFEDTYLDSCDYFEGMDSIENMITEFKKFDITCGTVTPNCINAIEKWDSRGYFYICFFINLTKEANTKMLIVFPRYEG